MRFGCVVATDCPCLLEPAASQASRRHSGPLLLSPPSSDRSPPRPPRAVAEQLPAVLLAAAGALAAAKQAEQLRTVVAFAAAVPGRIPQGVYQKLNQLQAAVA